MWQYKQGTWLHYHIDSAHQRGTVIPGKAAHVCHPSTHEAETKRSWLSGQPRLHRKFQASLGYMSGPRVHEWTS